MGKREASFSSSAMDCTVRTVADTDFMLATRRSARAGSFCRITMAIAIAQLPSRHAHHPSPTEPAKENPAAKRAFKERLHRNSELALALKAGFSVRPAKRA